MRVVYLPGEDWDKFYLLQASQSGHGIQGFEGTAYQRGAGIGNIFGRLFRFVSPIAKLAMKSIGKQALTTGADILSDVVKGRNIKESAKKHGKAALGNLAGKAATQMRQRGRGRLGSRPKTIKGGRTLKRKQPRRKTRKAKRRIVGFLNNVEIN